MRRNNRGNTRHVLVTGGAGFIGSNLVARLLADEDTRVTVFDNLARSGAEHNLKWLQELPAAADRLEVVIGDVRDRSLVLDTAHSADEIYHLAAQVAVTTSIGDPREDFEVNAIGTFNVLEAARRSGRRPLILFTSTNKVYGGLESVPVTADKTRYRANLPGFIGATEETPLDFHSPYGCSKGSADQYVRHYGRIYDLPTVVFRMSCIAGPRQFGNEDQGWVAHFLYSLLAKRSVNIFGDGLQVRDILHVTDLVEAMIAARDNISRTASEVYNVGGGMERAYSIQEMLRRMERLVGSIFCCTHSTVRPGDQPLYISNTSKLSQHTGWRPQRQIDQILEDIRVFWDGNRKLILAQQASQVAGGSVQAPETMVAEEVA